VQLEWISIAVLLEDFFVNLLQLHFLLLLISTINVKIP